MDPEEGRRLANLCFGCGALNPGGLRLHFEHEAGLARAVFTPCASHQGFPGMMHGGLAATLIDEAMGWAMYSSGVWAMTGRMDLRYRNPVPLDRDLTVEARVTKNRGRALTARGELRDRATSLLLVEAEALFVRVPPEYGERLSAVYRPEHRISANGE